MSDTPLDRPAVGRTVPPLLPLGRQAEQTDTRAGHAREEAGAIEAARAAGDAVRAVFGLRQDVRYKSGDDPLTAADEAADRIIRDRLGAAFPDDDWLSEEAPDPTDQGSALRPTMAGRSGRIWVIDPIDGTREFVDGIPEFAVSIALLVAGRPTVAVVYQPIRDLLVSAVRTAGARVDGRLVATSDQADLTAATLLASRSEVKRGQWDPLEGACRIRPTGSIAYKLACVAAGEADATISLAPKHGWDVAAGVLLVEEAGGRVSRLDGSALTLDRPGDLLDGLIASNGPLHDAIVDRVIAIRAG